MDINKKTNTWKTTWEIKHANKHTRYQIQGQTRQLLKKWQTHKNTEIEGEQRWHKGHKTQGQTHYKKRRQETRPS